jgi:hypothetical protein
MAGTSQGSFAGTVGDPSFEPESYTLSVQNNTRNTLELYGARLGPTAARAAHFNFVTLVEVAGAEASGDAIEIDECEEIDGAELGVDGGRAAKAAGDFEVGSKEAWCAWGRKEFAGLFAERGGVRFGAERRLD